MLELLVDNAEQYLREGESDRELSQVIAHDAERHPSKQHNREPSNAPSCRGITNRDEGNAGSREAEPEQANVSQAQDARRNRRGGPSTGYRAAITIEKVSGFSRSDSQDACPPSRT
jgi:hypothetical protein